MTTPALLSPSTAAAPADRGHARTGDARTDHVHAANDESTTAWALAARTGDPDAVDRFVRALHRDVLRYVAHLCADPQAVDDLAQDTFLRALGSLHRFEGRSSARSWLLSIARRAVADSFRQAAARPRLSDVPDWRPVVERAQPRGLPGFDDGVALLDLLATLPTERRARRSYSPSSSDCPTRRRPRSATAPWARSAPAWPAPGRPCWICSPRRRAPLPP